MSRTAVTSFGDLFVPTEVLDISTPLCSCYLELPSFGQPVSLFRTPRAHDYKNHQPMSGMYHREKLVLIASLLAPSAKYPKLVKSTVHETTVVARSRSSTRPTCPTNKFPQQRQSSTPATPSTSRLCDAEHDLRSSHAVKPQQQFLTESILRLWNTVYTFVSC